MKFSKGKEFNILPLTGLWQALFDAKYGLVEDIAASKKLYDSGLIDAIISSLTLRDGIMKKFDKYFISLVLFGSWARGKAMPDSDVDLGLIIDDTDVKETTRVEIREKIRKIVLGISAEVSRKLNVQIYLLTQFWEYVRDANPVIFTLLRDGVPIYDKGLFLPWKLLLKMGKIKPTPEAIESLMTSSQLLNKMVKSNINEIVIEKIYYAMINPAQAALMYTGIAPPVYSETPHLLERCFVEKKLLDKKYINWLTDLIELRKKVEHGNLQLDGKQLEEYRQKAEEFAEVVTKLFDKLKNELMAEKIKEIDYMCKKGMKDALGVIGIKVKENELTERFISEILTKEKLPPVYVDFINYFKHVKEDYKKGLVIQDEVLKLEKEAHDFIESVLNFVKTSERKGTDRFKMRCRYKGKTCEIWLLGEEAYIIKDVEHPELGVIKTKVKPDGSLEKTGESSIAELDKKRKTIKVEETATIKEETIESLKKILGEGIEIILSE